MRVRARPVPVVMFTADAGAADEARAGESARGRAAGFAAVLPRPFALDELLGAVAQAAGTRPPSRCGAPFGAVTRFVVRSVPGRPRMVQAEPAPGG
jgi:hypothetical protein